MNTTSKHERYLVRYETPHSGQHTTVCVAIEGYSTVHDFNKMIAIKRGLDPQDVRIISKRKLDD